MNGDMLADICMCRLDPDLLHYCAERGESQLDMNIFEVCSRTFAENMFPNEDPYCSFEESYPFVKISFES